MGIGKGMAKSTFHLYLGSGLRYIATAVYTTDHRVGKAFGKVLLPG